MYPLSDDDDELYELDELLKLEDELELDESEFDDELE